MDRKNEQSKSHLQKGRDIFRQIVLTREWNADHGGIYAPVSDITQPNLYLKDPLRDLEVNKDLKLTKINPAFMTRQLSEIAEKYDGIKFRITSLKLIRPQNLPTQWEKKCLQLFEKGIKEVGEFEKSKSSISFLYMAPLITKKTCLKCHSDQGYQEGDIRGGIRVTMPHVPEIKLFSLGLAHIGIGLTGLIFIIFYGRKLEAAYESLRKQAIMDTLTGIHNRRYFTENFIQEFKRSKRDKIPLSVIIGDIDYFKQYNDNYGHKSGDDCLAKVASTIKETLKRPGDLCARYGGEEFVIALPNTAGESALHVAEKIRKNVENLNIQHHSSTISDVVTISLGIKTDYSECASWEEVIRKADDALYRAKKKGRNRIESS